MRTVVKVVAGGIVAVLALSGCRAGGSASAGGGAGSGAASSTAAAGGAPSSAAAALELVVSPADGTKRVRPDRPVTVRATGGRITKVAMTAADGTPVDGEIASGGLSWTSTDHLAPSATYTLKIAAQDDAGTAKNLTSTFSTLRPATLASTSLQPRDGWVVGVGMPVILTFDRAVKNRDAVEKNLHVTATPSVEGAWRWTSSSQVMWRPKDFWKTGTKVSVVADLKGVEVSPGVWGSRTRTADYEIGSAMVSTVDIAAHTMTVRRNGAVIKRIPVTTGKPGLATRGGVKVIISRETTHRMDAATTGVKQDSPEYYNLVVKYAMRLTWSGEFIHAAPWSVASQGHANVSHGCTGMSTANAAWMFSHSKVGDVVKYVNGSRRLEANNGYTAWNMSFDQWSSAA